MTRTGSVPPPRLADISRPFAMALTSAEIMMSSSSGFSRELHDTAEVRGPGASSSPAICGASTTASGSPWRRLTRTVSAISRERRARTSSVTSSSSLIAVDVSGTRGARPLVFCRDPDAAPLASGRQSFRCRLYRPVRGEGISVTVTSWCDGYRTPRRAMPPAARWELISYPEGRRAATRARRTHRGLQVRTPHRDPSAPPTKSSQSPSPSGRART